ncbi:MDR family MFS transporter [Aspergillus homomorphus CBS 101889]|uniref:MFS general substrate transporter n=1 Tax=Aspergillus homomorphus (strain CBS 101889) TaxID=1450537 RepID=A0A395I1S2_ASPHC|nr:MFS general substrate transporter [Aspergillus homomorphus CBS 101889]RAL13118.1 MFS general substrate transporter [Aspergillus homomorphus CBS 101889]
MTGQRDIQTFPEPEICMENIHKVEADMSSPVREPDVPKYPSSLRLWLAVIALCLGIFLATLDSTIIATATPYITDEFHSLDEAGWYSSIYTMAICMSQLVYGKLSASCPIQWIYSAAMLLFLIGSAVCGSAPNSPALIAGRAIAGLGCSGLLIGAFSLVPFLAAPEKRPILLGLISGSRGLATTFGPLIGGALTERASWRWNFYINLPLGAVIQIVFWLSGQFVRSIDLIGFIALAPSVVCLLLALQWGGVQYGWGNARIVVLLILSATLGIIFILIEVQQGSKAMLPARIFSQRTVASASFFAFCTSGSIFILTYYLPIWFQGVKGVSPMQSGIDMLPWVITSTITSLAAGVLISKIGHAQYFLVISTVFGALGSGLFTTFSLHTTDGQWIGYQILYAISSSLASITPLLVVQNALALGDVPIGSSMVMFTQTLGASIFVSTAQALFTNNLSENLRGLDVAGLSANVVASGGITTITRDLSGETKTMVLGAISDALTQSWYLAVGLSCLSIVGALVVEQGRMKREN